MLFYRVAFFTAQDATCKRNWEQALQQSIDYPSLKHCATNTQLSSYLMAKYETYAEEHNGMPPFQVAAKYLGLQSIEDEDRVWVLNKSLQLNENGKKVTSIASKYVWLGDFAAKCKGLSHYSIVNYSLSVQVNGTLSKKKTLKKLVGCLKDTYETNYPAALLTLGAQIMSTHYEMLNTDAQYRVPATILHGDILHGKSLASKAALSILGIQESHFLTSITDTKSVQVTSCTTLGLVIDDPTDIKEISEKILYHFEKGIAAKCNANYTPRCTFISSINKELLTKLVALLDRYEFLMSIKLMCIIKFYFRYITRVALIRFANVTSAMSPSSRKDANKRLALAMKECSHGIATIIKLGRLIVEDEESLDLILNRLKDILPAGTRQRIFTSYALLLHSTFKV